MATPADPDVFERDMGCTEAEWLGWLPGACGVHRLTLGDDGCTAVVELDGGGQLALHWRRLPDRRIALMRVPRLGVRFAFDGAQPAVRERFLRYFDLYMQRGGG